MAYLQIQSESRRLPASSTSSNIYNMSVEAEFPEPEKKIQIGHINYIVLINSKCDVSDGKTHRSTNLLVAYKLFANNIPQ